MSPHSLRFDALVRTVDLQKPDSGCKEDMKLQMDSAGIQRCGQKDGSYTLCGNGCLPEAKTWMVIHEIPSEYAEGTLSRIDDTEKIAIMKIES